MKSTMMPSHQQRKYKSSTLQSRRSILLDAQSHRRRQRISSMGEVRWVPPHGIGCVRSTAKEIIGRRTCPAAESCHVSMHVEIMEGNRGQSVVCTARENEWTSDGRTPVEVRSVEGVRREEGGGFLAPIRFRGQTTSSLSDCAGTQFRTGLLRTFLPDN